MLGAGSVGLNILAAAKAAGARRIVVTALSEKRLNYASKLGAYATVALENGDVAAFVRSMHEGGTDVVFEATGMEDGLQAAIKMVNKGGRVVLAGYGRDKDMSIHVDDVHLNNLKVLGAGNNWNYIQTAINLLKDGLVNTECLATHFMPIEEWEAAVEMTRKRPEGFVKAVFTF